MKTIAITGSGGFVGTNIKNFFSKKDFEIISIRREDIKNSSKLKEIMNKADIVINLAGANIINRWTDSYKKELYSSRIDTTTALVQAMASVENKPKLFISTSAVGIYSNKDCYDEEYFDYADDFLAKLCQDWEKEAFKAKEYEIRTAIFRFGIVLGEGGALKKMLLPFKLGVGGTIGAGNQYFSFIHIEDLLNAYKFLIENVDLNGVFNLTAPTPTTNKGLTQALGKALNRPTIFPVPEFVLNLIFSEGAKVLTDGQCVKPKRLVDSGFIFKHTTIENSINSLIKENE
ncbi:TIGR01777 family oxidoreductase [Halarcobacter bivalviorum]|uniref:TIGR01777 family oxidoreductase n=1 Tax=Halarcobacter bivalviorum TaxID=663364 RepID=UPI00100B85F6|nr:TIGR01777 family oxidoreductase [Halarcobacter bivalviorum]RXK03502.1 TIGR01777 family protein [Halarcobacter bivalviorum]